MAKKTKAGEAYVKAIMGDPVSQKAWERTRSMLYRASKAFECAASVTSPATRMLKSFFDEIQQTHEKMFEPKTSHVPKDHARFVKQWEQEYGHEYPKTIEDIKRIAREAGIDANKVLEGEFTFADIMPIAEGYLKDMQAKLAVASKAPEPEIQGITISKTHEIISAHNSRISVTTAAFANQLRRRKVPVLGRLNNNTLLFDHDAALAALMKGYDLIKAKSPSARKREVASLKRRFKKACVPVERLS